MKTLQEWGFVLRRARPQGACTRCAWQRYALSCVAAAHHCTFSFFTSPRRTLHQHQRRRHCAGCPIFPSNKPGLQTAEFASVVVDWDPALLEEAFDRTKASLVDTHPSVAANRALEDQPLQLSQCFDVFSRVEQIDDRFCGKCSRRGDDDVVMRTMVGVACCDMGGSVSAVLDGVVFCCCVRCCFSWVVRCRQSKKIDVYRTPPVLVVQLKRFQYTQYSRRKLNNLVTFPLSVCICV